MQEYNNGITDTLVRNTRRSIASLPQPTMFGGKRARIHPKAGTTQYDYPGTLAVGRFSESPRLLGAGFWQDFGRGFKQGAVGTAKVAAPIVGEIAKDAALSYIRGGKRKKYTLGNFAKDLGDVAQPFKEQVIPVATGVAKEVARDAIKSYLKGGALIKNRPQEFHSDIYPQALASYRPQDSHMFGGDMTFYWDFVKEYSKKHPEMSLKDIRSKIKAKELAYVPEARKTRVKKTVAPKKRQLKKQAEAIDIFNSVVGSSKKKRKVKKFNGSGMYDYDSDSDDEEMTGGRGILDDLVKVSKAAAPYVPLMMMAAGRKQLPRSGKKRETARGDIVAAVMRQQGISLPAASRYVKDNGLY
jgi:hypothetical protein